MPNMRSTKRKAVMILPKLEDIALLKRYAIDHGMINYMGKPNVAGAINRIISEELRRIYPELTASEYQWCADEQRKNEIARKIARKD